MVDATSDGPARIRGRREEIVLMFTRTSNRIWREKPVDAKRGRSAIEKSDERLLRCVRGAICVPVVARCMARRRVLGQGVAPTI